VVGLAAVGGFMLISIRNSFRGLLSGHHLMVAVCRTRDRTRVHAGGSIQRCGVRSGGHNQVRTPRAPAIANREVDRSNSTLAKQL
jgi:hypothetical protein